MKRVDVEDVYMAAEERYRWNQMELKDIEFYYDGKLVDIPVESIEEHKFAGLSNDDFILNYDWPED